MSKQNPTEHSLPCATHKGTLTLGGKPFTCAVLENEMRLIMQTGVTTAIGLSKRGGHENQVTQLAQFVRGKALSPYVDADLLQVTENPVLFRLPNGNIAHGYDASILPRLCEAVVDARWHGRLKATQQHIADRCKDILMAVAIVGITALVDEATGYKKRPGEYGKLVELLLAKALRPWVKTFPDAFFRELCRLRGWRYIAGPSGLPQCAGHDINNYVYSRLPKDVRAELKRLAAEGHGRLHQGLSDNFGVRWLNNHLHELVGIMKLAPDWSTFRRFFRRVFPLPGDQREFFLDDAM